jgi:hypothetical protein
VAAAISVELWLYALRYANDCFSLTPFLTEEETPLDKFSQMKVRPEFKQIHTFGRPAWTVEYRVERRQGNGKLEQD